VTPEMRLEGGESMKADRTTKVLLLMIAIGLWLNALSPLFYAKKVSADTDSALQGIADDISKISKGLCLNRTICN
jgi:hypothetical protein